MSVIVKIRDVEEWWVGNTLQDIKNLSAARSIESGELINYDITDDKPDDLGPGVYAVNVTIYKRQPVQPNAEYQRVYRKKQRDAKMKLLREWVPENKFDEVRAVIRRMIE